MFKHKTKEYFFYKKRHRKITASSIPIFMTKLLPSQQLMHFCSYFYFFSDILPYISLPILFNFVQGPQCT